MTACQSRNVDLGCPLELNELALDLPLQVVASFLVSQVPLVERDHQRSPGLLHRCEDPEILFSERLAGIYHDHAHLRALYGALRTQARVVLVPGTLLDPATDSGGIDEPIDLVTELNELIDGIYCGPGALLDDYSLLSGDLVEQALLSDIRLPDDGNTTWTALELVCCSWGIWNRLQNRIQQVTAPPAVQCGH